MCATGLIMSTIKRHMLNMCMKYNTAGFIWFESCRVAVFLNEQAKMPQNIPINNQRKQRGKGLGKTSVCDTK